MRIVSEAKMQTTSRNGFNYDSAYNVKWIEKKTVIGESFGGGKLGEMSYVLGVGFKKNTGECWDIFSIEYDYKPSILNIFASNDYVANESIQKGMCIFSVPRNTVGFGFYVNFEYSFGYALTSKILPISINKGVSRKNKTTFFFEYNEKKWVQRCDVKWEMK